MLPNHAPLVIAEQFGTLESLYPGRIDLGLGRAPGSDQITARAMRRNLATSGDEFPQDVAELMDYFAGSERRAVRATPGAGLDVPIWILGSSTFGAQMAAHMGLPYAFASHFAPQMMKAAIEVYRSTFRPSRHLDKPYVMLGFNVFGAATDEEAQLLASSMQQAFVNLRSGRPSRLKPPVPGYIDSLELPERMMLDQVLSCSAIGSPQTVARQLESFIASTGADELMITTQIFDHEARKRSYEIARQARLDALG
jgi:luciferase family oxidoreductase group 1